MSALRPHLDALLAALPVSTLEPDKLGSLVRDTLAKVPSGSSPDNRRAQWEFLLKEQLLQFAINEGKALQETDTTYYDRLRLQLDLVLTFTELDVCDTTFPFTTLQDLLETHTIASCQYIFAWIEARADRLTTGLVPQKGKALILLRMLNDLLRRLSKMPDATAFCGRILTFLSKVFPLGERSGVNLRGDYGPVWEDVAAKNEAAVTQEEEEIKEEELVEKMAVDEDAGKKEAQEGAEDKMQVDEGKPEGKSDFYATFWSLQRPFSRPPTFAELDTFARFQDAVNKVLPILHEANAKDRLLMGSSSSSGNDKPEASLKRKREDDTDGDAKDDREDVAEKAKDYFFAKYLTSPELLELEIADSHFRRQFLFQLLILLQHLQTFTKAQKAQWASPRNRSLQMDFTLDADPAHTTWVSETMVKAADELRQTMPNGRGFTDTVRVILARERNWVRWKNEMCAPFDRPPWSVEVDEGEGEGEKVEGGGEGGEGEGIKREGVEGKGTAEGETKKKKKRRIDSLEEATRPAREALGVERPEWPHALGSEALTEIWERGDLDALTEKTHERERDPAFWAAEIRKVDQRAELRRRQLLGRMRPAAPTPTPAPAPAPASAPAPAAAASPSTHPLPAKPDMSGSNTSTAEAPAAEAKPEPKLPPDPMLAGFEDTKQRLSWLALRAARDTHLAHFGKLGSSFNIAGLVAEVERERAAAAAAGSEGRASVGPVGDEAGGSKTSTEPMATDA